MNDSRRQFLAATPALLGSASVASGCAGPANPPDYDALAARTWRAGSTVGAGSAALGEELVRCASLAPSSHNTQCWKFALEERAVTILPDRLRLCPVVDPDEHHVFVSLGCAAENLTHAALAHGLKAEAQFDETRDAVRIVLAPAKVEVSPLFAAIHERQSTRGDYDGKRLSSEELSLLERAGTSNGVRMLIWTGRPEMERLLDYVVEANTAQMADRAFVRELKSWIRFNGPAAVRSRDGMLSLSSGNPSVPTWLGELAFGWFYTPRQENDKYVRQIRSSAGVAVFIGEAADKSHWVDVGRSYQRFALQATALGIRNAFLNQPVEVGQIRPQFAAAIGLADRRPDLVVRFGRGPRMPSSLRRPVRSVLVS